jgi:ABC-type multidrug transport system ATPase subunit
MKLVLENVTKKYKDKTALQNISVELCSGQLIGLIGKNGAGKTTLLKLLSTIMKPTSGRILLDDQDIVKNPNIMRSQIGYLPQEVFAYPNLTVLEYLSYIASVKGMGKKEAEKQIDVLLSNFHLENARNKRMGSCSGGMKQRVGIICALLDNPQIIIIDEPTTGLDPEERIAVRNILSGLSKERIVILSTHIVSDIEAVASRILILQHGNLVFNDSPDKLIAKAKGCVWEYTLSSLQEDMTGISSMVQTEAGIHIRQVRREKPTNEAVSVNSTLEDACLLVLEGLQ